MPSPPRSPGSAPRHDGSAAQAGSAGRTDPDDRARARHDRDRTGRRCRKLACSGGALPLIDPQISGELRDAIGAQSHAQLRDALVGEAKRFFSQPHEDGDMTRTGLPDPRRCWAPRLAPSSSIRGTGRSGPSHPAPVAGACSRLLEGHAAAAATRTRRPTLTAPGRPVRAVDEDGIPTAPY